MPFQRRGDLSAVQIIMLDDALDRSLVNAPAMIMGFRGSQVV